MGGGGSEPLSLSAIGCSPPLSVLLSDTRYGYGLPNVRSGYRREMWEMKRRYANLRSGLIRVRVNPILTK